MKFMQTYRQIGQVRVIVRERPLAGVTKSAGAGFWFSAVGVMHFGVGVVGF